MKKRKLVLIMVVLLLGLSVLALGVYYFRKEYRIVKKSDLENIVKTSEETSNKLSETEKIIEKIVSLQTSVNPYSWSNREKVGSDEWIKAIVNPADPIVTRTPQTVTEYVPQPYPAYDNSGLAEEMSKLRRCIGTDFPGIWCR